MKPETYHFSRVSIGLDLENGLGAICLPQRDYLVISFSNPHDLRRKMVDYHADNDIRDALLLAWQLLKCPLLRPE